jgi:hypothetical protein
MARRFSTVIAAETVISDPKTRTYISNLKKNIRTVHILSKRYNYTVVEVLVRLCVLP